MKSSLLATLAVATLSLGVTSQAIARDTVYSLPLDDALGTPEAKQKITGDVHLYFAGQEHPTVAKELGITSTNRKTNAFSKSDADACRHVFLSAVLALQESARMVGGNAVIDIKSNYRNKLSAEPGRYTCGAGAVIAGVALTGEIARIDGQ